MLEKKRFIFYWTINFFYNVVFSYNGAKPDRDKSGMFIGALVIIGNLNDS